MMIQTSILGGISGRGMLDQRDLLKNFHASSVRLFLACHRDTGSRNDWYNSTPDCAMDGVRNLLYQAKEYPQKRIPKESF
jgi:hypothetical protein